jgi:2-dehydropantoate 2-reductase
VGAGAIGTLLGHTLASAGHRVTMIDLPRRVAQIRRDGLRLVRDGTELRPATVHACDDPCGAPNADFVFLATKAYHLPLVAPRLTTLLSRAAAVVTVQNGIPWWYFYGHGGPLDGRRLTSLDPDGVLEAAIDARQIVGCVAYPAASMDAEGRVHHVEGDHFPLGELDGVPKERTTAIAELLKRAGFRSRVLTDLRAEIWLKAWGALSLNPISALTGATMAEICDYPATHALVSAMMREAQAIAESLGIRFRHTIEKRIDGARAVGSHKTSMLQDLERGEPLELDALLASVIELGEITRCATTTLRAVHACAALLDRKRACHA